MLPNIDTLIARQKCGGTTCLPIIHSNSLLNAIAQKSKALDITEKKIELMENFVSERENLSLSQTHRKVLAWGWKALEGKRSTLFNQVVAMTQVFSEYEDEPAIFKEILESHRSTTDLLEKRMNEFSKKIRDLWSLKKLRNSDILDELKSLVSEIKVSVQAGLTEVDCFDPTFNILKNIQKSDALFPTYTVHPYFPVDWRDFECHEHIKAPLIEHMDRWDMQLENDLSHLELLSCDEISHVDEFRVSHLFDLYQLYLPPSRREPMLMQRLLLEYPRSKASLILQQVHANRKRSQQWNSRLDSHGKLERMKKAVEIMKTYNQTEILKSYAQSQFEQAQQESKVIHAKLKKWHDQRDEQTENERRLKEELQRKEEWLAKKKEERRKLKKERYLDLKNGRLKELNAQKEKDRILWNHFAQEVFEKMEKEKTLAMDRVMKRNEISKKLKESRALEIEKKLEEHSNTEKRIEEACRKLREKIRILQDPKRLLKPTSSFLHRQQDKQSSSFLPPVSGYSDEDVFRDQRSKFLLLLEEKQFAPETRLYLKEVFASLKPYKPYAPEWKSQIELGK